MSKKFFRDEDTFHGSIYSMKIVLVGSMSFLEKMTIVKTTLEGFGHAVVAPRFTEDEIKTGSNTYTDYFVVQHGIKNVLPDDQIWNLKERVISRSEDGRRRPELASVGRK